MKKLMTIGYEGAKLEDFVATLQKADVTVLIDIREIPASRKPGFSKRSLSKSLENAGLKYVHLRELGDPKLGREAARRGDFATFEHIFRTHLQSENAQRALEEAINISFDTTACLLCFERNYQHCHRAIVAEEISVRSTIDVRHLGVRHGLATELQPRGIRDDKIHAIG